MEIQESRPKATSMQKHSATSEVEVPEKYSRQKAIQYAKKNGSNPIPQSGARKMMYMMLMKIGATGELPQRKNLQVSFLNDFWRVMYFENNYCPGDIPFPIIMDSFTTAMVQGTISRKGNNQAAICQAFNKWITREDVRHRLYQKRDEMYPNAKPKQITKNATPETIQDYSDEELKQKIKDIEPMAGGVRIVDEMLEKLNEEVERRGL